MKHSTLSYKHILAFLLLLGAGLLNAQETIQLAQWAISAEASSQYGARDWGALQATGAPDVLACLDDTRSWASLTPADGETITLYYRRPVLPTQINIYQNFNPGAIRSVAIVPADGGAPIIIPNSADTGTGCPRVFSVHLPAGLPEAIGVTITLDQARQRSWNEIDAVELVGITGGAASNSQLSSLQTNAYPMYRVFSNTTTPTSNNTLTARNLTAADFGGEWGATVTCPNGGVISNAVGFRIVQQRSGSQYRVTAMGINGLDAVIAVMDNYGNMICNDDSAEAATYGASLPTTGVIPPAPTHAQVVFNLNSRNAFEDVFVVVGGLNGASGEILVLVEGMVATQNDGVGDTFSMYVAPTLVVSGVNPTVYMLSVVQRFDPAILLVDGDYATVRDGNSNPVACDDAGNPSRCWGESASLAGYYVSRSGGRTLGGGNLDAMMQIPIVGQGGGYYNFAMTSFGGTYGDYIAAFHLGTATEGDN